MLPLNNNIEWEKQALLSLTHKGFKECWICLYSQDKYYAFIAQLVEHLICIR